MSSTSQTVRILLFVAGGVAGLLALLELVEAAEYEMLSPAVLALLTLALGAGAVVAGVLLPQRPSWLDRALLAGLGGLSGLALTSVLFNSATSSPGKALLAAVLTGVAGTALGLSFTPAMQAWWSGQTPPPRQQSFGGPPPGWAPGPQQQQGHPQPQGGFAQQPGYTQQPAYAPPTQQGGPEWPAPPAAPPPSGPSAG